MDTDKWRIKHTSSDIWVIEDEEPYLESGDFMVEGDTKRLYTGVARYARRAHIRRDVERKVWTIYVREGIQRQLSLSLDTPISLVKQAALNLLRINGTSPMTGVIRKMTDFFFNGNRLTEIWHIHKITGLTTYAQTPCAKLYRNKERLWELNIQGAIATLPKGTRREQAFEIAKEMLK